MNKITTRELSQLKENLVLGMKQNFKTFGELRPCALIINPSGDMTAVAMMAKNQQEKYAILDVVKNKAREIDAIAIALINEAWIMAVEKGQMADTLKKKAEAGGSLEHVPGRKEAAIMVFETKLTSEIISFDIDRPNRELLNEMRAPSRGGEFTGVLSEPLPYN